MNHTFLYDARIGALLFEQDNTVKKISVPVHNREPQAWRIFMENLQRHRLPLAAAFAFLKRFVDETGIGSVSGFFGAYAGMAVVMRRFLGRLPDRIGPKRVLFPALASLAVGYLVLAFAETPRDVVIAGALCGAGHG